MRTSITNLELERPAVLDYYPWMEASKSIVPVGTRKISQCDLIRLYLKNRARTKRK
jgi:hypothetical protein